MLYVLKRGIVTTDAEEVVLTPCHMRELRNTLRTSFALGERTSRQ